MRILFVVDTLGAGGAERSLQELLPPLCRAGVRPVIACFHRRSEGVEDLVLREREVHVLRGRNRLAQMLALRKLASSQRFDLVHTTLFEADVFGRSALAGTRIPVVTSLVNMPYEPARLENDRNVNRRKLALARWLEIGTGKLANHFHAITQAVKDSAQQRLRIPESKITVVYRGRDAERLGLRSAERRARVRRELGIAPDAFVVLNAARQEYQKGQVHLIEAFEQVSRAVPSSLLLIAGRRGSASEQLLGAARDRPVRFLGHRDDVPDLMVAADVFALPSLWEGLGGVLIEAMGLGLPILASDLPPTREVLDNGARGVLVPAGSATALAQALERLASSPQLASELAAAAETAFQSHFTVAASAQRMLQLFESVCSSYASGTTSTFAAAPNTDGR